MTWAAESYLQATYISLRKTHLAQGQANEARTSGFDTEKTTCRQNVQQTVVSGPDINWQLQPFWTAFPMSKCETR